MSGIIKAADATAITSFDPNLIGERHIAPVSSPPPRSATELALDEAREEIARLQAQLLAAGKTRRDERDEAYAAGVREGEERAGDDAERRLASVREMADVAL